MSLIMIVFFLKMMLKVIFLCYHVLRTKWLWSIMKQGDQKFTYYIFSKNCDALTKEIIKWE